MQFDFGNLLLMFFYFEVVESKAAVRHDIATGNNEESFRGYAKVRNTKIQIIEGNLAHHKADALVNSTDSALSIQG